jgi:rod shape determining protein RodA
MRREIYLDSGGLGPAALSWPEKILHFNWAIVALLAAVAAIGFVTLYSAAGGSIDPWAVRQMVRFAIGLGLMAVVGVVDIRFWFRAAYPLYVFSLLLLVAVAFFGSGAMGAQRWLSLGFFQIQPSEVMKVALVLVLARHFHGYGTEEASRPLRLIVPVGLVILPVALVMKQPDLGTAMMLVFVACAIAFVAGVRLWMFGAAFAAAAAVAPVAWEFLHDYQRRRIFTFLDPETDPLGAGYHILQSKIALGSGGIFGKGFMEGTQSQLNFLPEKQTDFAFTMYAEEFGILGGVVLLVLYVLLIVQGLGVALRSRNHFGRLLAIGITALLFLYVFINTAMVMGIVPVVGVPLPLVSYGGTAMLSLMFSFGLMMSVAVHRDVRIGRQGLTRA